MTVPSDAGSFWSAGDIGFGEFTAASSAALPSIGRIIIDLLHLVAGGVDTNDYLCLPSLLDLVRFLASLQNAQYHM
jgi:hypothetical protein